MIDMIKKDNTIFLFDNYANVILEHSLLIDTLCKHTNSDALVALCGEAVVRYDEFQKLDGDNSKVNRWLGYIQGTLLGVGLSDIETERNYTRPYLTQHRDLVNMSQQLNLETSRDTKDYFVTLTSDNVSDDLLKDIKRYDPLLHHIKTLLPNGYSSLATYGQQFDTTRFKKTAMETQAPVIASIKKLKSKIEMKNMKNVSLTDSITANFDNMFGNTKTIIGVSPGQLEVTPSSCSLVLIKRGDLFLGVSRKHDHNDVGLPGGKLEIGETFEQAAHRESIEETGFNITLLPTLPYDGIDQGLSCRTYLAEITGKVSQAMDPSETGVVGFYDKQAFLDGSFGAYNELMFKHFDY